MLLVTLSLSGMLAFAQNRTVTGTVVDANGEPIPGANVIIVGTQVGATTDFDGNFSIPNVSKNAALQVSFIGYATQRVDIAGQSQVRISLAEDRDLLDEVVVIGYGAVRRRDLTGAVASVKGDNVKQTPVANVAEALQGRLPGVNVISEDGRPGATQSIRVRGGGSITQSNDPLFVVDGLPVGNINDIPASEIESIDVLKDASATAIYGSRGANGVILVTTKGSKEGKVRISYDGFAQAKTVPNTQATLNAQEYVLHNWSYAASRGTANADAVAKYFGLGSLYGNHYAQYANMDTHDYTDDILRTAWMQSHNVNISGGNSQTRMSLNVGYVDEQGVQINSDYTRFNADLKVNQKLARNLSLDLDIRYGEVDKNGRNSITNGKGSTVSAAYQYRPIDNPLGGVSFSDVASGFSFGVANIDDQHDPKRLLEDVTSTSNSKNFRGTAGLTWTVIDGLSLKEEVSYATGQGKSVYYENGYTNGDKRATLGRSTSKSFRSVTTASYLKDWGDLHSLNAVVGYELNTSDNESSSLSGRGYPDSFDCETAIANIHTASTSYSSSNTIGVPNHSNSFFGRAGYTLMKKYMITATFRADGSSKFAPNHRWGYFPAVAMAWRLSDEEFMASTESWLSNLKLRLSYGTSGSDNINSNLWRETWSSYSPTSTQYTINGIASAMYKPDGLLANNDLKWETTVSRNFGIDFGLLDGRINGSLELYWNTTKDLLMAVPVDNTTGYSYQYQNFGQTSNRGIELSVNADVVKTRDFTFNVGLIYNYNRNKLDEMEDADQYLYTSNWASSATKPTNDWMLEEGESIGIVRGFKSAGFYTLDDFDYVGGQYVLKNGVADITKSLTDTYLHPYSLPTGQTAFPGCVKLEDIDGSGKVDLDDATSLGEMIARHTGSINFNLQYKQFDLSAFFNWQIGGQIYNVNAMINASGNEYNGIGMQKADWISSAFKAYNVNGSGDLYAVTDPNELAALNANADSPLPYHQSGITESRYLEDGSYLRLKTLTLGYTLPQSLTRKVAIQNCRIYITGSNLFTITGYDGLDPEVNTHTTGYNNQMGGLNVFPTPNMDFGAYPRAKAFTIGASLTF